MKQWQQDNKEKRSEYFKIARLNPERLKAERETEARMRLKHPEKYKARWLVNNAIRDGNLKRLPCKICGIEPTHGHHTNYSKPLEVDWLCTFHHLEIHK